MRRAGLVLASVALAVGLLLGVCGGVDPTAAQPRVAKPNIILVLTDDLDARPGSISRMPELRRYLIDQGTTFENAFATTSLCCPSRATILRGQYSHNHGVLTNEPRRGRYERFVRRGLNRSTVATWLDDGGYRTVEIGKYLNGYKPPVPPGWDDWYANGWRDAYPEDWMARRAVRFIREMEGGRQPFFMWIGTRAPHVPAEPPPRYSDRFPDARAPRPPSFDEEDVSDKPAWIRSQQPLTERQIAGIDALYRDRLRSMLAVDDLVGRLVRALRATGELDNTYIVFTSDNGWSMGDHRRARGKWSAYEEDLKVPLIVRGPGVPRGAVRQHMVLNNDLAPTFAQLGRVSTPPFVDGRSFVPLLRPGAPSPSKWRSAFLAEAVASEVGGRPRYEAVRTGTHLWVEYANGERELYSLREDPHQTRSLHASAPDDLVRSLEARLDRLRGCAREGCRRAEGF